jgi:hypothetical protein
MPKTLVDAYDRFMSNAMPLNSTASQAALSLKRSQAETMPSSQARPPIARAKTSGSLLTPPPATVSSQPDMRPPSQSIRSAREPTIAT